MFGWLGCFVVVAGLTAAWPGPANADGAADRKALFGDLHVHTAYSFDAFIFAVRSGPDEAYRFAKGERMPHPSGRTYQLSRPLDFMAVTDHAEYLGVLPNMADPNNPYSKLELAGKVMSKDVPTATAAFQQIGASVVAGKAMPEIDDPAILADTWRKEVEAANRHNDPGRFTALIGYEWTSVPGGANLHRNVIFAGDSAPLPYSALQSNKPEDLWKWMGQMREQGYRLLAIPHNSNLSNGRMFERVDSAGNELTADYAATRLRNEPLVEITQVKGTSETNPILSPNDEYADFELVEQLVGQSTPVTVFKGGYVRDALRTGLELQDTMGFNPYRFGVIGSTDTHTAISPVEENNYSGKVGVMDGTPQVRLLRPSPTMDLRRFSASGLAGVWAAENTREGIFEALERKETWATTGPRIQLRFFGGWDMSGVNLDDPSWVKSAYRAGVSMGGDLGARQSASAPTFVVYALKDSEGANLDRIQIVKGWSDSGVSQERIYEAALSGGRKPDPVSGRIPPVGNSIDPSTLEVRNTIGAAQLSAVWTDPDFDPAQNAFYYVRAIEIPTPRWSTYDARTLGIQPPADLPTTIQERAFSSPIWYTAKDSSIE